MPIETLDSLISEGLTHPYRGTEFLSSAAGATLIVDALAKHLPNGLRHEVIWPAADSKCFFPPVTQIGTTAGPGY